MTGDMNRARKNYSRQARTKPFTQQVNLIEHRKKVTRLSNNPITLIEEEAHGLWHPHNDAIVFKLRISQKNCIESSLTTKNPQTSPSS